MIAAGVTVRGRERGKRSGVGGDLEERVMFQVFSIWWGMDLFRC